MAPRPLASTRSAMRTERGDFLAERRNRVVVFLDGEAQEIEGLRGVVARSA